MIVSKEGREKDTFLTFVENALGMLAKEAYPDFLKLFDNSRLSEQDLILALRYLEPSGPVQEIDDPALIKSAQQRISCTAFHDGSGYHMDYDLTTNGEINDLTLQVVFLKKENGYFVELDDLHTL